MLDKRYENIRRLARKGMSDTDIAKELGLSRAWVSEIVSRDEDRPAGRPIGGKDVAGRSWLHQLGGNLRRERVKGKLRLQDVADATESVTYDRLSRIERAEKKPSAREVLAICKAIGVSLRTVWPKKSSAEGFAMLLELPEKECLRVARSIGVSTRTLKSMF